MLTRRPHPQRRRSAVLPRRVVALAAPLLILAGCSSDPATLVPPSVTTGSTAAPAPATAAAPEPTAEQSPAGSSSVPGPRPSKVLVVIEENHTAASALQDMPFLASLSGTYGQATNYQAITHPSLPNYLAIVGGSTFGVTDDKTPANHPVPGDSVLDTALGAGRTAKTYAEAMPGPCATTSSGTYAVKHNPWAYFSDPANRANCQRFDLPSGTTSAGTLHDDITAGTLPTIGLLIPDLCNDAHDCPLKTADSWLQQWIPTVMQGPDYRAGRLTIVVTFDEDDNTGSNMVLTTVVAPDIAHVTSQTRLTIYSLTRYLAEIAGASPPAEAAAAPSLRDAFGL
jgi:hypothetical protein